MLRDKINVWLREIGLIYIVDKTFLISGAKSRENERLDNCGWRDNDEDDVSDFIHS